jgi:hypothetical protein
MFSFGRYFALSSLWILEKFLFGKVRGLNTAARQDSVRTIVDASRANILSIQEIKIFTMTKRVLLSAPGSDFSEFTVVPAVGASGAILVAWRWQIRADISRIG